MWRMESDNFFPKYSSKFSLSIYWVDCLFLTYISVSWVQTNSLTLCLVSTLRPGQFLLPPAPLLLAATAMPLLPLRLCSPNCSYCTRLTFSSLFNQILFIYFLFMAVPMAYGSSQAGGQIGAVAEGYTTATATLDRSCICNLHHSLQQHQILFFFFFLFLFFFFL